MADTRGTAKNAALFVVIAGVLLIGVVALYVRMKLNEGKSILTTADANRICRRALSASVEVTCTAMIAQSPDDPWGRKYLCEKIKANHLRVTSLGRDGRPGGQTADADVACEPRTVGNETHCFCRVGTR